MSEKTILVIDDSSTIRQLVDSTLSPLGYRVALAPTAEEGLRLAGEIHPDMILLDHQLPGTTGADVCRQLCELPAVQNTPVVVSSTLRKRAYVEYTDMPNVVDMLPKPYTADLLTTTVANALDTGSLVVKSQSEGTAVPEVIQQLEEADLTGSFRHLDVKEILDFLNNTGRRGILEIEAERERILFYLEGGRIMGVSASGVDALELSELLPSSLQSLAPVVKLTINGRTSRELDGIVELLDRRVLDPRLLRKLLRCQAALLTLRCFTRRPSKFRFAAGAAPIPLYRKIPLEISLVALLIEAAMLAAEEQLPPSEPHHRFVRCPARGQNLDRAGVSARHLKLLSLLAEPQGADQLATQLDWDEQELRRVLGGFVLSGLVQQQSGDETRQMVIFETNTESIQPLRTAVDESAGYTGRVVRDLLALRLVLKRTTPDVFVFAVDPEGAHDQIRELHESLRESQRTRWIGILPEGIPEPPAEIGEQLGFEPEAWVARPYSGQQLFDVADRILSPHAADGTPTDAPPMESHQPELEECHS